MKRTPRTLFLPLWIEPIRATAQSAGRVVKAKDGRMFVAKFQKGSLRQFENALMLQIRKQIASIDPNFKTPDRDLPVSCWIGFFFPPLQSTKPGSKKIPKTTRPDVDNMAKSVVDCMTKVGLVADDAQIFRLSLEKYVNPRSDSDRQEGYIAIHLIYHS